MESNLDDLRSDINDLENELFRIINRMMDSHDSIGREFLENSKLVTADKIAEFIHQGIRRSDLSFLEDVYICSRHFGAKKSKSFFNVRFNDTVPLVLAVQIGNEDIFNFLLDHGCDIEAKGNCEFDNETIVDVPPLWVAAARGNLSIVNRLLSLGANVNASTSTNSHPLRAACYDGHYDIVKVLLEHKADINMANRHGHTSLMIAAYRNHLTVVQLLLTRKDINVNAASSKGNTAMHDAAEAGNLTILQELLKHGAGVEPDVDGVTPLRLAALHGKDNIIQYFGSGKFIDHAKAEIAFNIQKKDIVESIELMGCWFVDRKKDIMKGLRQWSWGAFLRYPDKEDRKRIEKKEIIPRKELNFQKEANTPQEINDLLNDINKLRINSLLIRERILGPKNPTTVHYIRYRGAIYADSGDFKKCLDLWNYAIQLQLDNLPILSSSIATSFLSFVDFFAFCESRRLTHKEELENFFFLFNDHIRKAEEHADRVKLTEDDLVQFVKLRRIFANFLSVLMKSAVKISNSETLMEETKTRSLYIDQTGSSLLHYACDPEAEKNRRPLNIEANRFNKFPNPHTTRLILSLTDSRHIDTANKKGLRPINLAVKGGCRLTTQTLIAHGCYLHYGGDDFFDAFVKLVGHLPLNQSISLKCLSARAISKLSLENRNLPLELEIFLQNHSDPSYATGV